MLNSVMTRRITAPLTLLIVVCVAFYICGEDTVGKLVGMVGTLLILFANLAIIVLKDSVKTWPDATKLIRLYRYLSFRRGNTRPNV